MYEREKILRLHQQGYCTAAISVRLNLPSGTVRAIVAKAEAKAALRALRPENVRIARREMAEAKRANALKLLAEAQSDLGR